MTEGEGEWDVAGKRRSLDILLLKKVAKLSAIDVPGMDVGNGKEDLWFKSLFTVCQRCLELPDDEEQGGVVMLLGGKDEFVVLVVKRLVEKSKAEWLHFHGFSAWQTVSGKCRG